MSKLFIPPNGAIQFEVQRDLSLREWGPEVMWVKPCQRHNYNCPEKCNCSTTYRIVSSNGIKDRHRKKMVQARIGTSSSFVCLCLGRIIE